MVVTTAAGDRYTHVYGPSSRLFRWLDGTERSPDEAVFEGTAGAGKTHAMCVWLIAYCNAYPNSKHLILRSTRRAVTDSVLPILEKILGPNHPAVRTGGNRANRWHYHHPALGGEIILGGMDNKDKLYSTEYDTVYYNEANEETEQDNWESLHRCCRRETGPFNLLIGDLNPSDPAHFLNQRCNEGKAERLIGRLWHNPRYFDHAKRARGVPDTECWTARGISYQRRLARNLSGPMRRRLFKGEWCVAEGSILEDWDEAVHMVTGRVEVDSKRRYWLYIPNRDRPGQEPYRVELVRFIGCQDWGHSNPGCAQLWALDHDGRAYMIHEVYRRKLTHEQWARVWSKIYESYPLLEKVVCDWDAAAIDALNSHLRKSQDRMGVPVAKQMPSMAQRWDKHRGPEGEKAGINEVRDRLRRRDDGTRGLYILRGNLLFGRDRSLYLAGKPWTTAMEIPGWVYEETAAGKPDKERPRKINDHGCDAMRGMMTYLRDRDYTPPPEVGVFPPGSINNEIPGLAEWWVESGFNEEYGMTQGGVYAPRFAA